MSTNDECVVRKPHISSNTPMTSGEQIEAAVNILAEIQARYLYVTDLSGIDFALLISEYGYEFVRSSTVLQNADGNPS